MDESGFRPALEALVADGVGGVEIEGDIGPGEIPARLPLSCGESGSDLGTAGGSEVMLAAPVQRRFAW